MSAARRQAIGQLALEEVKLRQLRAAAPEEAAVAARRIRNRRK
jgi:hypothetical protein